MVPDLKVVLTVALSSSFHVNSSSSSHFRSELELNSISKRWFFILDNDSEVGNLDESPSLVGTVVAVPEDHMSHVVVVATVDIEALTSIISDVSSVTTIDSDLLVNFSSPWSDDSSSSDVETLSKLVRECEVSSQVSSDGSGSLIEDEMSLSGLSFVSSVPLGIEVVDSESELVAANVLVPEEVLASSHGRSDVELDSILKWLSVAWLSSNGVDSPSLVGTIVAVPPDNMSVVSIDTTVNIKALTTIVSNVSSVASIELNGLGLLTRVLSDNSVDSDSVTIASSVGEYPVSVVGVSNGVGS